MRVDREQNKIQSTMVGESVRMGIQEEHMAHVMEILAGLYSNRLLAVIREYSTNALDAHIDAGFSGPIEVTTPNRLTPFFKVRDFGNGLDVQGIREIYSQYGASTARKTDDQVGGFGLGAKSALAYNSKQFTVVSVKDGRRITVLVDVDAEGVGRMQVLGNVDGDPTDEASGTEVQVPVARDDIDRCAIEARNLYSYWQPGLVLLNGEEPDYFADAPDVLRLTDTLFMRKATRATDLIVMGNVPYPQHIPVNGITRGNGGATDFQIIALVPIGAAMPAPARESLKDTPTTKATITTIASDFKLAMTGAIQREIDACATPQDAIALVLQWAPFMPGVGADPYGYNGNAAKLRDYTFKGRPLPVSYKPDVLLPGVKKSGAYGSMPEHYVEVARLDGRARGRASTDRLRSWSANNWPTTLWVTGFEPQKFSITHKDKLVQYCQENLIGFRKDPLHGTVRDHNVKFVVLARDNGPSGTDAFYIDPKMVIKWEDVKDIKLVKQVVPGNSYHISGSFRAYTEDGYEDMLPGDKIRRDLPIMYRNCNEHEGRYYNKMLKVLFPKGYTFICIQANRINKFCREVKSAMEVFGAIQEQYKVWLKGLAPDQRKALWLKDNHIKKSLAVLDASKVKDKDLAEAIRVSKIDVTALDARRDTFRRILDADIGEPMVNPLVKYPLFNPVTFVNSKLAAEQTYKYLNMIAEGK